MNQKKNVEHLQDGADEYLAPCAKVVKARARRVMCSSDYDTRYGGFTSGEQEGS